MIIVSSGGCAWVLLEVISVRAINWISRYILVDQKQLSRISVLISVA